MNERKHSQIIHSKEEEMEAPREHMQAPFEMNEGHTPVHDSLYGITAMGLAGELYKPAGIIHTHAKSICERGHFDAVFLEMLFETETFWAIPRTGGNVYVIVKREGIPQLA